LEDVDDETKSFSSDRRPSAIVSTIYSADPASLSHKAPNTFWINFKDVDFSAETGKVMKLDLWKNQSHIYSGNAVKDFQVAKPFKFLGLS
jgi:hypothetical protein